VEGHSIAAAALMGQVRTAIHAHATAGAAPDQVLARTNRVLADLDSDARLLPLRPSRPGPPPGVLRQRGTRAAAAAAHQPPRRSPRLRARPAAGHRHRRPLPGHHRAPVSRHHPGPLHRRPGRAPRHRRHPDHVRPRPASGRLRRPRPGTAHRQPRPPYDTHRTARRRHRGAPPARGPP
jgi:hypothetical protein